MQMALEHDSRKKKGTKKEKLLTKTCKCYKVNKFLSKNDLDKSLF